MRRYQPREDILAAIKQRIGYVVYATKTEKQIGTLVPQNAALTVPVPLRIVGLATREEAERQFRLAYEIAPDVTWTADMNQAFKFFYRVEAVD